MNCRLLWEQGHRCYYLVGQTMNSGWGWKRGRTYAPFYISDFNKTGFHYPQAMFVHLREVIESISVSVSEDRSTSDIESRGTDEPSRMKKKENARLQIDS